MNENFWIDVERSRTLLRNILTFAQLNAYPFTYKFIFLRYEDEHVKRTRYERKRVLGVKGSFSYKNKSKEYGN